MPTLPQDTRLLSSSQNYPFLSRMTKGKSLRGRHLLIIGRASILILIIIISIIITVLICGSLGRRRGRSCETIKASLSSCNTTHMGVCLTQIITESVKVSIHVLKLHHDGLESHTTTRRRRSGGRRNGGGWRISRLRPWLFRSKLGLAPLNRHGVDGTHDSEVGRIRNRDGKMAKDPRDSQRKKELIMDRRITIDIYDRDNEMRGKVYGKIL